MHRVYADPWLAAPIVTHFATHSRVATSTPTLSPLVRVLRSPRASMEPAWRSGPVGRRVDQGWEAGR